MLRSLHLIEVESIIAKKKKKLQVHRKGFVSGCSACVVDINDDTRRHNVTSADVIRTPNVTSWLAGIGSQLRLSCFRLTATRLHYMQLTLHWTEEAAISFISTQQRLK